MDISQLVHGNGNSVSGVHATGPKTCEETLIHNGATSCGWFFRSEERLVNVGVYVSVAELLVSCILSLNRLDNWQAK